MIRMKLLLAIFSGIVVFSACNKFEEPKDYSARDEQIILDYIAENEIEGVERDDSGLYYKIINPGEGAEIAYPYYITATYKGYLTNGTVFDQTQGGAASFYLSQVIPGWQIGIPKIAKGGEIQLFIPSALGYGNASGGLIPANSVLIFEVQVIDEELDYSEIDEQIILDYIQENNIEGVEKDESGLYYKIIEAGEGDNVPEDAIVDVLYKGYLLDGEVFDEAIEAVTFSLDNLIEGWKIGIPKVAKGGKVQLFIPSALAYGYKGAGPIAPYSVIIFEISVEDFQ
ncbi:hypothetical protein E9993_03290 [Labilibacter sediminis]|nr:hypothetical protein E9993_03290 [Labilibacter sediminis]